MSDINVEVLCKSAVNKEEDDELGEYRRLSNMKQLAESSQTLMHPQVDDSVNLDFISRNRTTDTMRRQFLSRLTYNRVWLTPLNKPKLYETVIIFDWDDTLLCTSFINPTGTFNPKQKIP